MFNIAGHAAVGCGSAVASGGKCGAGALSGAVGSFATSLTNNLSFEAGLIITTTAGGLASVAGGGKFGNGAVTAAFGYFYNGWLGRRIGSRIGAPLGASACAPFLAGAVPCGVVGYVVGGQIGSDVEDWLYDWGRGASPSILGPDPNAVGPHSTWKGNPPTRTETWVPNPQKPSGWDSEKATDLSGKPHYDKSSGRYIPTPHTHLPDGKTRPATPDEIP